ncbi:MAG TPA: alpha/beta hydrolase [Bdellovibrionales bacterium]|nr:alpha/beta hydrolase [Pseudobdellovibrionaceae bacterium]HAG91835.1 alpha/beta hydrolase [Bdellovibrionales bacterium]|tara:strand:+ start:3850 stop:4749 length:900 start_codon:yes stop_codon:yes gene_type:complete
MSFTEKQTGYFKSFDGTRIYYEIHGEGEPLILNYGIGCLINHWHPQIKHFSKKYKVIVYDYRAHHLSEIPENQNHLDLDSMAQDIQALCHELQIEKAHFCGHSFGVQLLIRTYDMFPELFEDLVFINGFVQNPLVGMFGNDLALSFFHLFKSGYGLLPETLTQLWKMAIQNPLAIHLSALAGGFNLKLTALKDIEIYAKGVSSLDLNAFICMFESMLNYDGRPVLERIQVPTLVIAGANDSVTPLKHQKDLHYQIKNSSYLLVPYGSHCSQLDMPDLVNLKMDQFYMLPRKKTLRSGGN